MVRPLCRVLVAFVGVSSVAVAIPICPSAGRSPCSCLHLPKRLPRRAQSYPLPRSIRVICATPPLSGGVVRVAATLAIERGYGDALVLAQPRKRPQPSRISDPVRDDQQRDDD